MDCFLILFLLQCYIQIITADLQLGSISIPSCKFGVYGISSEADVINDGWVRLTINDLNNADIKSQLITEYNANGGFFNFIQPFTLSNCCWRIYDSTAGLTYTFSLSTGTATYYYPAHEPSLSECESNPTTTTYGLYDSTNNVHLTSLSSTVTFSTTSSCGLGNNPTIYGKCCEFGVYDYADTDVAASTNNWISMNYADFQSSSPYKEFFINAYNLNSGLMRTISSWTLGNCAITYGEGTTRIQINGGTGYLRFSSSCATLNVGTAYNLYSSSSSTTISTLSLTDQFTTYSCCSNIQNPGFYRKCTAATLNPTTTTTTTTSNPTKKPTIYPTKKPTVNPTKKPTINPTEKPTVNPTKKPTVNPTKKPTVNPTKKPTVNPTQKPTSNPTKKPTVNPTKNPTLNPTDNPTPAPTTNPTKNPTLNPTDNPTPAPTTNPTKNPTKNPTQTPTLSPTTFTLNPTKTPTSNPTKNPTQNPTKNPTQTPTYPEGVVIDVTSSDDNNNNENTYNNNELKSENTSLWNDNNLLIYIIAGAIGILMICCIILFTIYSCKKRNQKKVFKPNTNEGTIANNAGGTNGFNIFNTPNTSAAMVQLGSVSPRSINSTMFGQMSFDTPIGMTEINEGNTPMGTNYNEHDESDDGDNELFVDTGAHITAGGDNNDIHLPELPNNAGMDASDSESGNGNDILYKKQVTTGGGIDMDLYDNVDKICKLCDQCGKSVDVTNGGKVDKNDGHWYCHECWDSFYD